MYGIVILNYNSYELSCNLVTKVLGFKRLGKVVLIDNNSKDNFDEFVSKNNQDGKIHYIKSSQNSGYAAGNNIGLKYLYNNGYKIGFVANPDADFEEDATDKIYDFLLNNPNYGVASCKRTVGENGKTRQYWDIPTFKDCLFESVYLGRKMADLKYESYFDDIWNDKKSQYYDVEVVAGDFFGCNLDIMNKVNYMDENTFLYFEENILGYKLRKAGYKEALLLSCSHFHNHIKTRRGSNNYGIYLHSKKVYCYDYLKINFGQKILMGIFDAIGLLDSKVLYLLGSVLK